MSADPTKQPPWTIDRSHTALLIVDMQNDFVNAGAVMEVPMARQRIPQMQQLQKTCRANDIPILYTAHVLYEEYDVSPLETLYQPWLKSQGMRAGTAGIEVVDELKPLPHETVIHKHRYDAFFNTNLDTVLRNIKGPGAIDTLIIAGTVTSICCESTARAAFMRDYKVAFVDDACGDADQATHDASVAIMGKVFSRAMTVAEVTREIEAG